MAEYNFWDDRTYDTCDENWCPIANDYCLKDKDSLPSCNYCKEMQEYMRYIDDEDRRKMWSYVDLCGYITSICLDCVKETSCPSYHPQCFTMIKLAYFMILDHLY